MGKAKQMKIRKRQPAGIKLVLKLTFAILMMPAYWVSAAVEATAGETQATQATYSHESRMELLRFSELQIEAVVIDMYLYFGWLPVKRKNTILRISMDFLTCLARRSYKKKFCV